MVFSHDRAQEEEGSVGGEGEEYPDAIDPFGKIVKRVKVRRPGRERARTTGESGLHSFVAFWFLFLSAAFWVFGGWSVKISYINCMILISNAGCSSTLVISRV